MKKIASTALACVAIGVGAEATAANMRELAFQVAMPAKVAPKIDGALDDACWKTATVHPDYYEYLVPNPRRVTNTKTDCLIVYDAQGVYTGIRNWEDAPEKLRQNCKKNNQQDIWLDDSGEIYYDPDAAGIGYYKFIVNSLGKFDTAWRMDGANMHEDWTCGGCVCAAKVFDDRWEVELFIPWSAFHGRPGPKPGDVWTFNHSRYRFGKLGWGKGFSTSAPGGSGVSANKFGYLYFSDGSKPDPKRVLDILEKRLNVDWGISIGGTVYIHDATGTRTTDLLKAQKALVKEFGELESSLKDRLAKERNNALNQKFNKAKTSFTNEVANFDGSFAAVKTFGELVDTLKDVDRYLAIGELASTNPVVIASAKKLDLPLAGTYDLTPPKKFDGHNGWYRHNFIRSAYPTPHLAWTADGKDPAAGPRILFMPGFNATSRDCIEYTQRFGAEDLYFPGNFGATGIYQDPLSLGTYNDKQRQFETLLAKNPALVAVWGFEQGSWPAKYRYEVLRRVRDDGIGLVVVGGNGGFHDLTNKLKPDYAARREIAARAPVAEFGVPGGRVPAGQTASEQKLTCYRFGKGRIVYVNWGRPNGWSLGWKGEFESRNAFMFNVFQWALGCEPGADIVFQSDTDRENFAASSHFLAFDARVKDGAADTLTCRLRNAVNEVVSSEKKTLKNGANLNCLPTEKLPGGDYYLDLIASKGGQTVAVSVKPFSKASSVGKVTIDGTNVTVVAENSRPNLVTRWTVPLVEPAEFHFELYDQPYRQLREVRKVALRAGARECGVRLEKNFFPTLSGVVKVRLVAADGRELGAAEKVVYFPNHRFEDYTLISWGGVYEAYPEFFGPKLVDEFGYRNHLGSSGNGPADFDCRAVPYAAHVALGGGKDGTSWRTYGHTVGGCGDRKEQEAERKALGEDWNIYRPEVRAHLEKYFTMKVKKTAPYGVSVWSLGDECGYSNDIGFGTNGVAYFTAFLKTKYGTIEKFNAVHGTSFADFAEAPHKTCKQSVDDRDWPSWFDQVQYSERMYSDFYQFLAGVIHKYDPKGRVGAEGSSGGDLELTVDKLQFWGPYRALVADELLKSIAPDRVRGTWWGGYLRSSRNGFPVKQWEFVLTGTVNADEWFAVSPGSTEGSHGGDLMPAPYVQAMMPHLQKLRRGQAQLLIRTPWRKDGFAFFYSHPSGRASGLDDRFLPQEESLGDLIRFCYRKGYAVEMITEKTIAKLDGQKVLFLAGASALSDAACAKIAAFAEKGGIVVSDQPPALLSEYLQLRKVNPLAKLFGAHTFESLPSPDNVEAAFASTVTYGKVTRELKAAGKLLKVYPGLKGLQWTPVGKGGALLVGTTFSSLLVNGGEGAVDALAQGILDLKGIVAKESVTGLKPESTIFRVRELPLGKGKDGKPQVMTLAGIKTDVQELGKDVTLDFGKEGYVYEVDTGFVGKQSKVELKKLAVPFKLYTQFAEEQKVPVFALVGGDLRAPRAGQLEVAPGAWLTYETKNLRQGSVYRLEVVDPAGKAIVCREELFCADARKEPKRTLQFPFNDKPGVYTVKLTDIATGLVATQPVTVGIAFSPIL